MFINPSTNFEKNLYKGKFFNRRESPYLHLQKPFISH